MLFRSSEREEVNPEVRRKKFELIFDPNLSVIVVFSGKRVDAKKIASANHSCTTTEKVIEVLEEVRQSRDFSFENESEEVELAAPD